MNMDDIGKPETYNQAIQIGSENFTVIYARGDQESK